MRKPVLFFVALFFILTSGYAQSPVRSLPLPADGYTPFSGEDIAVSPGGSLLCVLKKGYTSFIYWYDQRTYSLLDSTEVQGTLDHMQWSADGKTLAAYHVSNEVASVKEILLFGTDRALKGTIKLPLVNGSIDGRRFSLLNFRLNSTASEFVAILYDMASSGAQYEYELTGNDALSQNKKYQFTVARIETTKGDITGIADLKASYARVEGKWNNNWVLLQCNYEVDQQVDLKLSTMDFGKQQVLPLARNADLFRNERLSDIRVVFDSSLYVKGERYVYELREAGASFTPLLHLPSSRVQAISSLSSNTQRGTTHLLAIGARANRAAENELWLYGNDRRFQKIDMGSMSPDYLFLQKDSVKALQVVSGRILIRSFGLSAGTDGTRQEVLVQLPFEADQRVKLPETNFLIESNATSWQVVDLSTRLVIYRQKEKDVYGLQFTTLHRQPFFVKYSYSNAEVIPVGKWDQPVASLSLKHPVLFSGSNIYHNLIELQSLAFNPATGLLSGVFAADSSYYLGAWKVGEAWQLKYVVKIGKAFPKESSWGETSTAPLSKKELLASVAYKMTESDWQKTSAQITALVLQEKAKWALPESIGKQINFSSGKSHYYEDGRWMLSGFTYQDSIYGFFLADLDHPSNSIYFSSKLLKELFPNYKKAAMDFHSWQMSEVNLSDAGNFAVFSGIDRVLCYDLKKNKVVAQKVLNDFGKLGSGNQYLLEDENVYINNDNWLDRYSLKPVHSAATNWLSDSALYKPEENAFIVNTSTDKEHFLQVQLDKMTIVSKSSTPVPLVSRFINDTTFTMWNEAKGMWVIAGREGIALDTGKVVYNSTPARLIPSALNGDINFVQLVPNKARVVIGNTGQGQYECWDINKESLVFRLVIADEQNFFVQSASGYYYATPNALPHVGFLYEGKGVPAILLDAGMNRPDLVMKDLLDTATQNAARLIDLYRKAALKKSALSLRFQPAGQSPVLSVTTPGKTRVEASLFPLTYAVKATASPVRRLQLQINNVPVWDTVFTKPVTSLSGGKNIQLANGENQIVLTATDTAGNSSLPVFKRVVYAPAKAETGKTYVITIAVNRYTDTAFNLRFAVKDGRDLLTAFKAAAPEHTITDSLFNTSVTVENLKALKSRLMQTGVEDKVVISFSGHGMLDEQMNFYYATQNMDFSHPAVHGFSFAEMEQLLSGIPARRKLLLIDACNSGNIDKDLPNSSQEIKDLGPAVKVQNTGLQTARGIELPKPAGVSNQQLFSQLFSLSSSVSGAEIIAATAGNAFAYEAEQWKNGVFTYAILKAFEDPSALDKNYDGGVSIRELKRFVYPLVQQLTKGKQQPLAKYENPNYDWDVITVKKDQ